MTIYRGYEITRNSEDRYTVHSQGSYPIVNETFKTEEEAMDHIEQLRRRVHQESQL